MNELEEYKPDFINFVEAGFIAINQSDEDGCRKLFKAAEILDPTSSLPTIGIGYLHLQKLELKQACDTFQSILKDNPNNDLAKNFLGLSLCMTPNGVEKGEKLLHETEKSEDPLVKKLSKSALAFVHKFVKKNPTPVEGPIKHK